MDYKVSVIVPVFKVEGFITRCADSLLRQTLAEVEFIFVNDATPDMSIRVLQEVIAKYPARKADVVLLEHEENEGLPAARNTGLKYAKGEYVFHCDSDDFVETDMLEKLYQVASEKQADIVWCDWWLSFEKNERYMKQPDYSTHLDALKGMLSGVMKFNVWNKLVRRTLYSDNDIFFPSGYGMGEDMTMMMLFSYAKNIAYVPAAFYHYVKLNSEAFSQTYSDHHLEELKHNVQRIADFIYQQYGDSMNREIAFFKLDVKFPFLLTGDSKKYNLWKQWFPESNGYIGQNLALSFRCRMIQKLASKNQFWAVKLYYMLLHRIVYGVLYK